MWAADLSDVGRESEAVILASLQQRIVVSILYGDGIDLKRP